jgi:hypothetical protein
MASKKAASFLMLALIVCAGMVGYLTAQQTGVTPNVTLNPKHAAIVQKMAIQVMGHDFPNQAGDSGYIYLDPKCVDAGTRTSGKYMSIFVAGKDYDASTWIWQRYGDTELCMAIWGPGEDGETFGIEIGKTSWDGFTVKFEGNTVLEIPAYSDQNPTAGYYDGLYVKVQ